jgi:hypothetical protein
MSQTGQSGTGDHGSTPAETGKNKTGNRGRVTVMWYRIVSTALKPCVPPAKWDRPSVLPTPDNHGCF